MKCLIIRYLFILVFFVAGFSLSFGQISYGGKPLTFSLEQVLAPHQITLSEIPVTELLQEDEVEKVSGNPLRFSVSVKCHIDFSKDCEWYIVDNHKVGLLKIKAPVGFGMLLYYSDFMIPDQGKLFIYTSEKKFLLGSYTSATNPERGYFATELVPSGELIIEYNSPASVDNPKIIIEETGIAYKPIMHSSDGFGGAGACEVNINCEEGSGFQDAKRALARIIVKQGASSYWCTGSLLNNIRQDFTPYLLTADHCGFTSTPQELGQWIFYFKYEGPECSNPLNDLEFNSYTMTGATKIAAAGKMGTDIRSDFKLLVLNESIPPSYNPYFLGWSIADTGSPFGVSLHHPQGDIMKISTYQTPLVSTAWANTPNTHWKVLWAETPNGHGVTEGGSSGCPILDSEGRVIGQLTGGEATCNSPNLPDYYGQFRFSWDQIGDADSTKLKPWLDPDNSGLTYLNGGWLGIDQFVKLPEKLELHPNPANDHILLNNSQLKNHIVILRLINSSGLSVKELVCTFNDIGEYNLDLADTHRGLYFISLTATHLSFSGKVLVIK